MHMTDWQAIRELAEDLTVISTGVASSSPDHGPRHWRDVARVGLGLWAEGVEVKDTDMVIVLLFAMLHDTQRLNEFEDPEHGFRAADVASRLSNSGRLLDWLDGDRALQLEEALRDHNQGEVVDPDDNVAVALCWDSDRLTLPRVGITPDDRYLSTSQAKGMFAKGAAYGIVGNDEDPAWEDIITAYENLKPLDVLNPGVPPSFAQEYRNARREFGDDLHPGLRLDRSASMTVIRSRFVQDVYMGPPMHAYYNARFVSKQARAEEALAEREWFDFIMLHEKPYRLDAIHAAIEAGMSAEDTAEQVGGHWTHSENIYEQQDEWIDLWTAARDGGHLEYAMDEEERAKLDALPATITVYRGYNRQGRDEGLSWTLDLQQAVWFARRWAREVADDSENIGPHVVVGTVSRTDVLAYFAGRGEQEIVVLPEDVRVEEHVRVGGSQTRQPNEAA
jgi:hypothetical protein